MGIRTWINYCGYNKQCCEGLKQMLDLFCFGCHTPEDVGGCHRCAIGQANDMMLQYIKDNQHCKLTVGMKKLINIIETETPEYKYLRIRSHFRPKIANKTYIAKAAKGEKKFAREHQAMIKMWAKNAQECDRVLATLDKQAAIKDAQLLFIKLRGKKNGRRSNN